MATRSGLISQKLKEKGQKDALTQDLEKTEIGQTWLDNKALLVGILVLAVAMGLGGSAYYYLSKKWQKEEAAQVFAFTRDYVTAWSEKKDAKLGKKEVLEQFSRLENDLKGKKVLALSYVQLAQSLAQKGEKNDAIEVLKRGVNHFGGQDYLNFLLKTSLASLLEDEGRFDEAIGHLQSLEKANSSFLVAKREFDLARLHEKKGDLAQAKVHYQKLVDKHPSSEELAKVARVKLQEMP